MPRLRDVEFDTPYMKRIVDYLVRRGDDDVPISAVFVLIALAARLPLDDFEEAMTGLESHEFSKPPQMQEATP